MTGRWSEATRSEGMVFLVTLKGESLGSKTKSIFLVGPGRTTLPIEMVNYLEWNIDPTIAAVAAMQTALIATALIISDRFFNLTRAF